LNQAVLPLLQPTNNTEIQKKISNAPEAKEGNFSDVFDNAVKEQSISQKDGTANKISEKKSEVLNTSSEQVKLEKTSNVQNSDLELSETVSAKEFLEKLGLDEDAIQEILQINELSENSTLLELLNNLSLTLDNQNNFLKTPAIDFFKMLGIEGEKIEEIFQQIAGQSEKSQTDISVKNLFENIGLGLEKYTAVEMEDLSVENFFQKLGLNEKESLNLVKELGIGKSLNDPALLNVQETDAKDLLKQMGLNSDEITKIIEKSIKNSDDKNKIKELILNKDFSTLKKLVSSEKFNINSSGKSDFQGMFQAVNKNAVSDTFANKFQSEMILPTNSVLDSSPVPSVQSSGSMNGTSVGSGTNGYTQMANISKEIPIDTKLTETTPKAFFEKTVVDQIVSKVSFKVTGGQEEIKIRLEPPSLGSLQLKVSVEGKIVNAAIVADNNITKEIIQSNLQQLKDSMTEQGLKLDDISVLVGDGSSRDKDMDEFRMLLTKENIDQAADLEEENNSNLFQESSGNLYRTGHEFSQNGVDLFI